MSSPPPHGSPSPPIKSPPLGAPESSIALPKQRGQQSPAASVSNLPYRRSNQSLSSLFASTSSLPGPSGSGPSSGTATPTLAGSTVYSPGGAASRTRSPARGLPAPESSGLRDLIVKSFAPHVAVLASAETDDLIRQKGFPGGFLQLVRPFGEKVPGKVIIRNSIGASTSWDDFGIRFTGLKDGLNAPRPPPTPPSKAGDARLSGDGGEKAAKGGREGAEELFPAWARVGGDVGQIEEVVDRHLSYAETRQGSGMNDYFSQHHGAPEQASTGEMPSPFYMLYLRRLLSAPPMSPHETFAHPVACVVAISSRNPSPIDDLRRLYNATNMGDYRLPQWVNNEYLRYYVLVHDEDHDDIKTSTALYEQMKRHFGLHCHLLRLRSEQCLPGDDDALPLPTTEWISAAEELAEIQRRESSDDDTPYLFESDATSLRTLVRELTTQSIIPSMERSLATWNESVLSRRRGISGRFMSLSKRWTPFGGGSGARNSSGPLAGLQSSGGSSGNYDSLQGFYRPESPEATMRKLADYAVMMRDWKLAASTYDLLRSDFHSDKAWRYHAGACEMCAVATLMDVLTRAGATAAGGSSSGQRARLDSIDTLLETASYSYVTRCIAPFYALRALSLGAELLKMRGSLADDAAAAKWHCRVLEAGLVAHVGAPLAMERASAAFAARAGVGTLRWGSRQRKAGFWAVMASESWLRLGKVAQAGRMLERVGELFGTAAAAAAAAPGREEEEDGGGGGGVWEAPRPRQLQFEEMRSFIEALRQAVLARRLEARQRQRQSLFGEDTGAGDGEGGAGVGARRGVVEGDLLGLEADQDALAGKEAVEEVSEKLDARRHRKSLSVAAGAVPPLDVLSPLSPARVRDKDDGRGGGFEDDNFE